METVSGLVGDGFALIVVTDTSAVQSIVVQKTNDDKNGPGLSQADGLYRREGRHGLVFLFFFLSLPPLSFFSFY
jgi:hypothetical protein